MSFNIPVPAVPALSALQWQAKWLPRFPDNNFEEVDPADFREFIQDTAQTFPSFFGLDARYVRGLTYPVDYTDQLGAIPPDALILGMQAVARLGVDSATGGAGITAAPIYYQLLKSSTGTVDALLSLDTVFNPDGPTAGTVKAHWVQVSGTDEEKIASFPVLQLEDQEYVAGEVVQYTFPSGQAILIEWRNDSTTYVHPLPTGLDSDPIYKPFAPLNSTSGHTQNTDIGTSSGTFRLRMNPAATGEGVLRTVIEFGGKPNGTVAAFGFKFQNSDGTPAAVFERCMDYKGTSADVWLPLVSNANSATVAPSWSVRAFVPDELCSAGGGLFRAKSAFTSTINPLLDADWASKWYVQSLPIDVRELDNPTATPAATSVTWNGLQDAAWLLREGQTRTLVIPATFIEGPLCVLYIETDNYNGNDLIWSVPAGWKKNVGKGASLSPSPDKNGRCCYTVQRRGQNLQISVGTNFITAV